MKVLILSFSANKVNEDSFVPNKIGLTLEVKTKNITWRLGEKQKLSCQNGFTKLKKKIL